MHNVNFTGWTLLPRSISIYYDLETTPFYIKTESVVESSVHNAERMSMRFENTEGHTAGGFDIYFTSPPKNFISSCRGWTEFSADLIPADKIKIFRVILKRNPSLELTVYCNDVTVLSVRISETVCVDYLKEGHKSRKTMVHGTWNLT